MEWCYCKCCTWWSWSTFSRSRILECEYLANGDSKCSNMTFTEVWSVNISKTMRAIPKNVQELLYKGWYLPSNDTIANVVLHDLDLNFQGQTFQVDILTSKGLKYIHYYWHQIRRYLSSNGATASVLHNDLDLQFKVTNFESWTSRKR